MCLSVECNASVFFFSQLAKILLKPRLYQYRASSVLEIKLEVNIISKCTQYYTMVDTLLYYAI